MLQLEKPIKKGKTDTFVLTDEKVELLKATIEYRKSCFAILLRSIYRKSK